MTPTQVLNFYKNNKIKAAAELGVTPMQVYNWIKFGRIPPHRQLLIEKATRGALKADEV